MKLKNDLSPHSDLFYTKHPRLSHVGSITLNPMIHVSEVCYDAFSTNYFCLRITVITFWVAERDLNCSHDAQLLTVNGGFQSERDGMVLNYPQTKPVEQVHLFSICSEFVL